ncbi:MAG: hypothetical protein IJ239_02595, partial [Eubacterium sp.]|nr:hypothetical protein [Eubacterium sp.]
MKNMTIQAVASACGGILTEAAFPETSSGSIEAEKVYSAPTGSINSSWFSRTLSGYVSTVIRHSALRPPT